MVVQGVYSSEVLAARDALPVGCLVQGGSKTTQGGLVLFAPPLYLPPSTLCTVRPPVSLGCASPSAARMWHNTIAVSISLRAVGGADIFCFFLWRSAPCTARARPPPRNTCSTGQLGRSVTWARAYGGWRRFGWLEGISVPATATGGWPPKSLPTTPCTPRHTVPNLAGHPWCFRIVARSCRSPSCACSGSSS